MRGLERGGGTRETLYNGLRRVLEELVRELEESGEERIDTLSSRERDAEKRLVYLLSSFRLDG